MEKLWLEQCVRERGEKKSTWRIWIYYRVYRSEERKTKSEEDRREEEKKSYTNLKYIFWIRYTFWHVMFRPDINWSESTICKTKIMLKPSDSFCMSCISYLFSIQTFIYRFSRKFSVASAFSHEICWEYWVNIEFNCCENLLMCLNSNISLNRWASNRCCTFIQSRIYIYGVL